MIWWMIAALCAFFVKGLCGFANTLVFTTILSFADNNINISPVELILGYPTNVIMAYRERRSIRWKICLPLTLLVIAGSIPGALFLKNVDTNRIKLLFGGVIIVIGLEMLFRELHTRKRKQSKGLLVIIGILSGLLCGLYGIGALLGAYLSRVTKDSSSFKANICVFFLAENTIRLGVYGWCGIMNADAVRQAVILIPFMLAGLGLGMLSDRFLSEKVIRKLVMIMLIASGIALMINSR